MSDEEQVLCWVGFLDSTRHEVFSTPAVKTPMRYLEDYLDRQRVALIKSLLWSVPLSIGIMALWAMGYFAAWDRFDPFLKAHTYRNLTSVSEVIAAETQAEVWRAMQSLRSAAERVLLSGSKFQSNAVTWTQASPELLDLALWTVGSQGPQMGQPQRKLLVFNSRNRALEKKSIESVLRSETVEKSLIPAVLLGREMVASQQLPEGKTVIWMATPLAMPVSGERYAVVGHWELARFQTSVRRLGDPRIAGDGTPHVVLADAAGVLLGAAEIPRVERRESVADSAVWKDATRVARKGMSVGFISSAGGPEEKWAVVADVGIGGLKVLSTLSRDQALLGLNRALGGDVTLPWLARFLFVLSCSLLGFFALFSGVSLPSGVSQKWTQARSWMRKRLGLEWGAASDAHTDTSENSTASQHPPRIARVAVVHGSLRGMEAWIQERGAEPSLEAINEFLTVCSHRVKEYGGVFERQNGWSFAAFFGVETDEGTESWRALRCALELRQDFFTVNAGRKIDGQPVLVCAIGVHVGSALIAPVGPADAKRLGVVGETVAYARALDQHATHLGKDIVLSQAIWSASDGRFQGEPIEEVRLTPHTGLEMVYSITAYLNEKGEWVTVEPLVVPPDSATRETRWLDTAADARWMVNNGTQMLGPLTASRIAELLFAQELDFESECFEERSGKRATIAESGIFSGSEDAGATLWIFDGKTIHGPVSAGFVETARKHGAIPETAWICERSTLTGWRPIQPAVAALSPEALAA